nr:pentatricopeptide repeat-containing protein At5g39680 [Tanacetum cinerariifolium]
EDVSKHNQLTKLMQFLMGPNDVFQPISREESHRGIASSSSSFVTKPQVGHIVDRCFDIIEYPPGYNKNIGPKTNSPRTFNANFVSSSSEKCASLSSTNEQMMKLMNLINEAPSGNDLNFTKDSHVSPCDICHKAKQTREPFPFSDRLTTEIVFKRNKVFCCQWSKFFDEKHSDFQSSLSSNDDGRVYDTLHNDSNDHSCSSNVDEYKDDFATSMGETSTSEGNVYINSESLAQWNCPRTLVKYNSYFGNLNVSQGSKRRVMAALRREAWPPRHETDQGVGSRRELLFGRQCHGYVLKCGLVFFQYVKNGVVRMYAKVADVFGALEVLCSVPGSDSCTYNLILGGLVENGYLGQGLGVVRRMVGEGVVWNKASFIGVFGLCGRVKGLRLGREVYGRMVKSGVEFDVFLCTAVIDMYGKCREVLSARKVFDRCRDQNVVPWTAMLAAYSQHGLFEESLKLFLDMQREDVVPNESTFSVVLNAIGHAGHMRWNQIRSSTCNLLQGRRIKFEERCKKFLLQRLIFEDGYDAEMVVHDVDSKLLDEL